MTARAGLAPERVPVAAYRSASLVMGCFLAAKLLGFVEKQFLAYRFGTSADVDAFLVAFGLLIAIYDVVRNAAGPAFLPRFIAAIEERSERGALRLAGGVITAMAVLLVALAASGMILAPWLVDTVLAPSMSPGAQELTARLVRILLATLPPIGVAAITYLIFNGLDRFLVPALGELGFKVAGTVALVVLVVASGLGIEVLAVGYALGGLVMLGVHLLGLGGRRSQLVALPRASDPALRAMAVLAAPLTLAALAMSVRVILEKAAATGLGSGSVAAIGFAYKLVELPMVCVGEPLAIVFFAAFARLEATGDVAGARAALASAVRACLLFSVPLVVGLVGLDREIVRLLFEVGAFDARSTEMTVAALVVYAPVIVLLLLDLVLSRFCFACRRILPVVFLEVGASVLNVALLALLGDWLGIASVPAAFLTGRVLKVAGAAWLAVGAVGAGAAGPWVTTATRLVVTTAATAGALWCGLLLCGSLDLADDRLARAVRVAVPGVLAVAAFLVAARAAAFPEIAALERGARDLLRRAGATRR